MFIRFKDLVEYGINKQKYTCDMIVYGMGMFTRNRIIIAAIIIMLPVNVISGYYAFSEPPDFTLTVSPDFINVDPGNSTSTSVKLEASEGFSSSVDLRIVKVPEGVEATLEKDVTQLSGDDNVTLTLNIDVSKDLDSKLGELIIEANGGGIIHKVSSTINIVGKGNLVIIIDNFWYYPDKVTVRKGTNVTWINEEQVGHTATSYEGVWNSALLNYKESYTFAFNNVGSYGYYCIPHPQMIGTVTVIP